MKRNAEMLIKAPEVSPVFDQAKDEAGNGILGFTIHFTDNTFKNIIQSYTLETKEQIFYNLTNLRQSFIVDATDIPIKQNNQINKRSHQIKQRRSA